jgi:hypothetical protein
MMFGCAALSYTQVHPLWGIGCSVLGLGLLVASLDISTMIHNLENEFCSRKDFSKFTKAQFELHRNEITIQNTWMSRISRLYNPA